MKCPECVASGKKSRITPGMASITAMHCAPYYDEEGVYHLHDFNTTTTNYGCTNGHQWRETSPPNQCPGCEWPDVKEKVANHS
jgi:rubrerythrin